MWPRQRISKVPAVTPARVLCSLGSVVPPGIAGSVAPFHPCPTDLVSALQGEGPFTVFAPTNEAFGKIDKATLGSLLQPENKSALANILTYHVVPSKLMASDVVAALKKNNGKVEVKGLNGQILTVMSKDGKIWIKDQKGNYSEIVATDVKADNGVIHVIDTVVMPK